MNVVTVTIGALAPTSDTLAFSTWREPARAARCLWHAFYDVPEVEDTSGAEATAKGGREELGLRYRPELWPGIQTRIARAL
jgi:hypothetical protein